MLLYTAQTAGGFNHDALVKAAGGFNHDALVKAA